MTYDGDLAVAAGGALFQVDRDLNLKGTLALPGETVESGICVDEDRPLRRHLSAHAEDRVDRQPALLRRSDGGWQSTGNTVSRAQAAAAGALTTPGGSGGTPTLMGFVTTPTSW